MNDYKKWQTTASKYLVNDQWLKLRADTCITPEGHTKDPYYVMEYPDWVNCLVIDQDDNAVMVRQYRHGIQQYVLEVVGGWVDPGDNNPAEAARREVQEEVGYTGGEIVQIGKSYANPAMLNNIMYFFMAFGGACDHDQNLEPGETLFIEKIPFVDLVKQMSDPSNSETFQSFNISNLFLALNYIKASDNPQLQRLAKQLPELH